MYLSAGCGGEGASRAAGRSFEAISLLGDTLRAPLLPDSLRLVREAQLAEARQRLERSPEDPEAWIWVGRRTAYLGRYREAISVYTEALERFPEDPRLYRHRGHRYITVREFDRAVEDLERAASLIAGKPDEVEPDGLPNPRNIPTSTLHFNIWYHLGLAYYLKGDLENALEAYRRCLEVSRNPDALVATTHWLYMTLRRLGRDAEAEDLLRPIVPGMDIIENAAYYRLGLMYRGLVPPDSLFRLGDPGGGSLENVTLAYGVGAWHLYNGRPAEAERIFRAIVERRDQWAAFGYIAAEAELARGVGEASLESSKGGEIDAGV
jgi:tetratricopeptide (TPR) repeat protein